MVQVLEIPPPPTDSALRALVFEDNLGERHPELFADADIILGGPSPSERPTTTATARALDRATRPDPAADLPYVEPDDGLGP